MEGVAAHPDDSGDNETCCVLLTFCSSYLFVRSDFYSVQEAAFRRKGEICRRDVVGVSVRIVDEG